MSFKCRRRRRRISTKDPAEAPGSDGSGGGLGKTPLGLAMRASLSVNWRHRVREPSLSFQGGTERDSNPSSAVPASSCDLGQTERYTEEGLDRGATRRVASRLSQRVDDAAPGETARRLSFLGNELRLSRGCDLNAQSGESCPARVATRPFSRLSPRTLGLSGCRGASS